MRPSLAIAAALSGLLLPQAAPAVTPTTLWAFCQTKDPNNCHDGIASIAPLLRDSKGDLFGTTQGGGENNRGEVFELQYQNGQYRFRRPFSFSVHGETGYIPMAGLIMDVAGNLYGTTSTGGPHRGGTVFELTPGPKPWSPWTFRTLHDFCVKVDCADGKQPQAELTYQGAASGVLYDGNSPLFGTTKLGGAANKGVAFELDFIAGRNKPKLKVLHDFCSEANCADGSEPLARMTADASGNLYGTASSGGTHDRGVAFEMSPNARGHGYAVLYDFCALTNCADGGAPNSGLNFDATGALIGTTAIGAGAGTVFSLEPNGSSSTEAVLYTFCPTLSNCTDGADPSGPILIDGNGDLIGTTYAGGYPNSGGVVFKLHNGSETVLTSFCDNGACGSYPFGGVISDGAGNLFGVTAETGPNGGGTIYELTP
jgi:uncharacterized repeat protein (TIGR03803 family)